MKTKLAVYRLFTLASLAWLTCARLGSADEAVPSQFETRTYPIQPGVFRSTVEMPQGTGQAQGTPRENVKRFFEDAGVPFPSGTSITFHDRPSMMVVKNTPDNLKIFETVLRTLNVVPTQLAIEVRFIQMTRETANDLFKPEVTLGRVSVIKEEVLRRIRELEDQKKITVVAQPRLTTVSGNTAQVKSVEEFRYATEFGVAPPKGTNAPSQTTSHENVALVPGGFETRELGILLNATPTLGPDGQTISLTLVPEISARIEPSHKIELSLPSGKVVVEQPRFRSRQITTTVQMLSGTTILLGVADPLLTEEDKDQIILILVTATVVTIQ